MEPGLNILEGLCFDRNGDLFVCNTPMGRIYKIDMQSGQIRLFTEICGHYPSAIKIHRDGRIFVTMAGSAEGGLVCVLSPEGDPLEKIVRGTGRMIDDMVFDSEGGFYLTDLGGTRADRSAGVPYVEPDLKTVHAVIEDGMVASNGIALAPDGRHLWVTEYGTSVLHYVGIGDDHFSVEPCDSFVPYHFSGLEGPDSCCIDADDNLYVAMCGQGRFLVFNPNGLPIGQILLPGREEGHMLKSTHPCLRPGTREVYLCSADLATGESAIFVAEGFAEAYRSYQFQ